MRILRVIATVDPQAGGPTEGLRQTSRLHSQWGHETVVASCDIDQTPKSENDGFELVPLGPGKYGWAYSKRLRIWLEENIESFDLVIMHGLWLYPSWALARVFKERRKLKSGLPRFLVFSHGMLDPWFQSWRRRPIKTLRNHLYWKLFEALTIDTADALLFTSSEERRLARIPFRPYNPSSEIVVPYGTSSPPKPSEQQTNAFKSIAPELGNRPYLLFLSRLHEKKGIDLLIKAYAEIKAANCSQSTPFPALVIAGPGDNSSYGKSLKTLVGELKLQKDVIFTGMVKGDEKWGAYHGCEAFVLPSHQENFGIAVAEALACAKAVLVSNKVNIWKELEAAKVGYVADDTTQGITSILNQWLDTSLGERNAMSRRASKLFAKQYHIEASAEALLDLTLTA